MGLRDYQARALSEVEAREELRVCLVSPTGSGKSVMGREWIRRRVAEGGRGLVLAHRIELVTQMVGHLESVGVDAAVIAPGYGRDPGAPVQCANLDTLVARADERPPADFILWDECHHAQAKGWRAVLDDTYPTARVLGLTATPQRGDGKPLGDVFGAMVVAAHYSELLRAGHIVNCRIFRPDECIAPGLAWEPADAWVRHAGDKSGFVFCRGVDESRALAAELCARGVPAENIDGKIPDGERRAILERFRSGETRVLCNVFVLTEGFDVPNAEVCMLARGATHAGTYLQMVGRVLRPAPGKTHAMLIDLPGVSHLNVHDIPVADRIYSLDGRAIKSAEGSVKLCPKCACTMPGGLSECPECGHVFEARARPNVKIWGIELREYIEDLAAAPTDVKAREYLRLRAVARGKGFDVAWVVKEYRKLFGDAPVLTDVGPEERREQLQRFRAVAAARGFKPGFAAVRYKELFGQWPARSA